MNQIQEAIARVTGIDTVIESQQTLLGEIADVMEQLTSDNLMLQRQIEDLDYLNLFDANEIVEALPTGDRKKTLARLRRLRHDNPLAKQAVKLVVRFTLGKGVQWVLTQDKAEPSLQISSKSPLDRPTNFEAIQTETSQSDPTRDIITSFWQDSDNKLAFTTHKSMQVMLDEIVTDGEKFYACFESQAAPYLKVSEIPVEEIVQVIYNPNNKLQPVYYKRQFTELEYDGKAEHYKPKGDPKTRYYLDYRITDEQLVDLKKSIKISPSKIDESKVRHIMINEVWTRGGKRGVSELYASREWFRVFREFMEGRAAINAAAQAISYIRKIRGGPSAVASFKGKFGGLNVGDNDTSSEIQKLTKPVQGAVYDSNQAVDLDWMKTDTGAQNAKEDAHMLLATGGAGVGTMVHYFGEGGDANLATAQAMELPMVKTYEDWQQFIEDFFKGWIEYLLTVATDEESAQQEITRVGFTFPPIISQDVVKYTTSWAQVVRDIAPNNMAVREQAIRSVLSIMGVPNIDGLMPDIQAEMHQAELMRQQQAQAMIELSQQTINSNGNSAPPNGSAPRVPNDAMSPNMKKLVSGKGEKISNGPKPA